MRDIARVVCRIEDGQSLTSSSEALLDSSICHANRLAARSVKGPALLGLPTTGCATLTYTDRARSSGRHSSVNYKSTREIGFAVPFATSRKPTLLCGVSFLGLPASACWQMVFQ